MLVIEKEFRGDAKIEILFAETQLAQGQKRIFRALIRQGVDARDGVAKRAIRVNEAVDPRLKRTFANAGDRRAVLLRQIAKLEAFEKGRPARIDRLGILLPAPVIFVDQLEICPSGN